MKPLYIIILCVAISTACAYKVGMYTADRARSYEQGVSTYIQLRNFCEKNTNMSNWEIQINTGSTTGTFTCVKPYETTITI